MDDQAQNTQAEQEREKGAALEYDQEDESALESAQSQPQQEGQKSA